MLTANKSVFANSSKHQKSITEQAFRISELTCTLLSRHLLSSFFFFFFAVPCGLHVLSLGAWSHDSMAKVPESLTAELPGISYRYLRETTSVLVLRKSLKPNCGTLVNHAAQIFHQVPGILGPTWPTRTGKCRHTDPRVEWWTRPKNFSRLELGRQSSPSLFFLANLFQRMLQWVCVCVSW